LEQKQRLNVVRPTVGLVISDEPMRDALVASLTARGFESQGFGSLSAFLVSDFGRRSYYVVIDLVTAEATEEARKAGARVETGIGMVSMLFLATSKVAADQIRDALGFSVLPKPIDPLVLIRALEAIRTSGLCS
jgi:hypothetical protein